MSAPGRALRTLPELTTLLAGVRTAAVLGAKPLASGHQDQRPNNARLSSSTAGISATAKAPTSARLIHSVGHPKAVQVRSPYAALQWVHGRRNPPSFSSKPAIVASVVNHLRMPKNAKFRTGGKGRQSAHARRRAVHAGEHKHRR